MYAGVPIIAPVRVSWTSNMPGAGGAGRPAAASSGPVGGPFEQHRLHRIADGAGPCSAITTGDALGGDVRSAAGFSVTWRARPKSMTRTSPSRPTMTLSGLKSRWTSPFSCAATRPRPAARNTRSTSCQLRGCAASQ